MHSVSLRARTNARQLSTHQAGRAHAGAVRATLRALLEKDAEGVAAEGVEACLGALFMPPSEPDASEDARGPASSSAVAARDKVSDVRVKTGSIHRANDRHPTYETTVAHERCGGGWAQTYTSHTHVLARVSY